jgi:hypothetical protein
MMNRDSHDLSPTEAARPTCGWNSDLPTFTGTEPRVIRVSLERFVRDAGAAEVDSWRQSIPSLQRECRELIASDGGARAYTAILEYELPLESRRADVVVLENGVVVVMELKGKERPSTADLDQVMAYARDLRAYHAECHDRPVHAVLVPTRAGETRSRVDDVFVAGPGALDQLLLDLSRGSEAPALTPERFLRDDAYRPMPTLVAAARELFQKKSLPFIKRARALTDPAVNRILEIAQEAAATRTRRLLLVTGVPGSGKTLVGLRMVHDPDLDRLAVERADGKPASPAVFLSGNGSLVQVLQDALKGAGGGGRTFVRGVKEYVRAYSGRATKIPPEHLLVFDEAQRAFDAAKMAETHDASAQGKTEPEWFVEFAERVPEWCVVVGLIGGGQEIHVGEEGGIAQWREAIERSRRREEWTIHAPAQLEKEFVGLATQWEMSFNLDTEIRYHLTPKVHEFVNGLLEDGEPEESVCALGEELRRGGHRFLVTRDLEQAKRYARERYEKSPLARYGLLASSKDRDLVAHGVDNSFQTTKQLRVGPWYNAEPEEAGSCCRLETVATEFSAQGLELDLAIVAWGTDFVREGGRWSNRAARGYKRGAKIRDAMQLRRNAYRVLMTRGRDGTVVFVPPIAGLDETWGHLCACGFGGMGE